jgi:hypothetical protein
MHKMKWWIGGAGALAAAGLIYWSAPDRPGPAELGAGVAHHAATGEEACEGPLRAVPAELPASVTDACPAAGAGGIRQAGIAALEVIDLSPALEVQPIRPAVFEEPPVADGIMPMIVNEELGGTTVPMVVPAGHRTDRDEEEWSTGIAAPSPDTMPYADQKADYLFYPGSILRCTMEAMERYRTTHLPCYRQPEGVDHAAEGGDAFRPVLGFCEAYLGMMMRMRMETDTSAPVSETDGQPAACPYCPKKLKPAAEASGEEESELRSVIRVIPRIVSPEECGPKVDTMEVRPGDVRPLPFGPI